ncbi:MAG: efflux transporter outer membrane subunit [Ferrovum sp.]|nr:efflux transporter outer membrane subunit [Ferrovum sp.]
MLHPFQNKPKALFTCVLLLTGCAVGPDYHRPDTISLDQYHIPEGWTLATPQDDHIPSNWWALYNDPKLNELENKVAQSNQTLAQKEATYRQSLAVIQATQAGLFPILNLDTNVNRSKFSGGSINFASGIIFNTYSASMQASWTPDLWGSVRRSIEANEATADSDMALVAATLLSLQSQLAVDYFQLRSDDSQIKMLTDTVAADQKYLELTQDRYTSGVAALTDVLLAKSQLKIAQSQLVDVGVNRAQMEHGVAVLIGQSASHFHLPFFPLPEIPLIPKPPLGLSSNLLQRRPDIASAERGAAAASAQIGVAQAAFFPTFSITGNDGFQSSRYQQLLTQPNGTWGITPDILQPLFDAGLRQANKAQAIAAYDQAVANYRELVIEALQNVEDNLSAQSILTNELVFQDEAVKASQETLDLTVDQYQEGIVNYLIVATAQATLLTAQVNEINVRARQLIASIQLMEALGGGWEVQLK